MNGSRFGIGSSSVIHKAILTQRHRVNATIPLRFTKPDERAPARGSNLDILGLSPGLEAAAASNILEEAGFQRKASHILSGPGWREEHITYERTLDEGQTDQLQIIYAPEIDGENAEPRITCLQRHWQMAGRHTISDIERAVKEKYGISLARTDAGFAAEVHTTRDGRQIDLADWNAGCVPTNLQSIPFIKAFSDTPKRDLVSVACGTALTVAARPVTPGGTRIASLFVSLTDVDQIWRAAWEKWKATTGLDIEAALDELKRDGDPPKL